MKHFILPFLLNASLAFAENYECPAAEDMAKIVAKGEDATYTLKKRKKEIPYEAFTFADFYTTLDGVQKMGCYYGPKEMPSARKRMWGWGYGLIREVKGNCDAGDWDEQKGMHECVPGKAGQPGEYGDTKACVLNCKE